MKREISESAGWGTAGTLLAAEAFHWFITPIRHPHATTVRSAVVGFQLVAGIALVCFAILVRRHEKAEQRTT